jgi:hypothetical protein
MMQFLRVNSTLIMTGGERTNDILKEREELLGHGISAGIII